VVLIVTYGDIYKQFIENTGIDPLKVNDYRPCCTLFDVPNLANAIVVWLNDGSKLIYILKGETL
jgi:hypothetical protein